MVLSELNNAMTMLTYRATFEYNRNGTSNASNDIAHCLQRALPPDP